MALGVAASKWMQQMLRAQRMYKGEPDLSLALEHSWGTGHLDSPILDEEPVPQHMKSDPMFS